MRLTRTAVVGAGLSALALAAGTAGAASAATGTSASATVHPTVTAAHTEPDNEKCEAALPAMVLGNPGLHAGADAGVRIWHDGTGWHLRATHPGNASVTYTGVVRSGQPISAAAYQLEKADWIHLSNDHRTLTFSFVNHGAIDGIDFTDRCAINTRFSLQSGGHELEPAAVYLGMHGAHPTTDPFLLQRHRG